MRGRKPFDAAGWLTSNPLRALVATEGTGLEPVRACAQRFSRPPPYQLGLALPITTTELTLRRPGEKAIERHRFGEFFRGEPTPLGRVGRSNGVTTRGPSERRRAARVPPASTHPTHPGCHPPARLRTPAERP